MSSFWTQTGKVIKNVLGKIVLCANCPCIFSCDANNCWEDTDTIESAGTEFVCDTAEIDFPVTTIQNSGITGSCAFPVAKCIQGKMDTLCLQGAGQSGTYTVECCPSGPILELTLSYNSGDTWTTDCIGGTETNWVYDVSFDWVSS